MVRVILLGITAVIAAIALSVAPVSAQSANCKKKGGGQVAGAIVGGLLGGFLGNRVDGGRKRGVGTVVGALGGALIGSAIGKKLDSCEKEKVDKATLDAVNDPDPGAEHTWVSDTRKDVTGGVVAAPPQRTKDGRECRTVTQVAYVSGEEVRETPTLCRVPPQRNWAMSRT